MQSHAPNGEDCSSWFIWLYMWTGRCKEACISVLTTHICYLGKAAASVAQAYPMIKMLLDETSSNQFVDVCKIYTSIEYFSEN